MNSLSAAILVASTLSLSGLLLPQLHEFGVRLSPNSHVLFTLQLEQVVVQPLLEDLDRLPVYLVLALPQWWRHLVCQRVEHFANTDGWNRIEHFLDGIRPKEHPPAEGHNAQFSGEVWPENGIEDLEGNSFLVEIFDKAWSRTHLAVMNLQKTVG